MDVKGYQGSVSFDGATVTVRKFRGSVCVPLRDVTSVEITRAGLGMRAIRFAVAGGSIAAPMPGFGSHRDAARDPYCLTFRVGRVSDFEALRSAVLAARSLVATRDGD